VDARRTNGARTSGGKAPIAASLRVVEPESSARSEPIRVPIHDPRFSIQRLPRQV